MKTDILLLDNISIVSDPLGVEILSGQGVAIEKDVIIEVAPACELHRAYPSAHRLDGRGAWLLPGLIDAHTHLYSALTLGMPSRLRRPRNFPQILKRIWWQFDKALDEEAVHVSALVGCIASLKAGITTIMDHHSSPSCVLGSLDRVAAGIEACGLRASLAYEVSERDGATIYKQAIAENERFIQKTMKTPDGKLHALFGLHAVFSLSDRSLEHCAERARALNSGLHMHMAEHRPEVEKFARKHSQSIPRFLSEIGILGKNTILAHTVHIADEDIELLKETGTFNVHNPRSNMGNGVGIAPVDRMLEYGQPTGLGSDGFFDIPNEMTLAKSLRTLKSSDPSAFSDQDALHLVYHNNIQFAEKLFGCRLGRVSQGYRADLILIDYHPWTPVNADNLSAHILSALNSGAVRTVIIDGQVVMEDGRVCGVDETEVRDIANRAAEKVWSRL